jgi:hypothetical protein
VPSKSSSLPLLSLFQQVFFVVLHLLQIVPSYLTLVFIRTLEHQDTLIWTSRKHPVSFTRYQVSLDLVEFGLVFYYPSLCSVLLLCSRFPEFRKLNKPMSVFRLQFDTNNRHQQESCPTSTQQTSNAVVRSAAPFGLRMEIFVKILEVSTISLTLNLTGTIAVWRFALDP